MGFLLRSFSFAIFALKLQVITAQDPPGCVPNANADSRFMKLPAQDLPSVSGGRVDCTDNVASGYPCSNVHLEAFVALSQLRGRSANDIWGWTSPFTEIEYALIGIYEGTSFVSLEDPTNPVVLGVLPSATDFSDWRDIKVYDNHAFIVSEAPSHGMQVFDLQKIENVTGFTVFEADVVYDTIGSAHNIAINEESGYAFIVGCTQFEYVQTNCNGGLHMVDISDPINPIFAGCYEDEGYIHDVQCIIYDGPDSDYTGKEICFSSNVDDVDILDVTDKSNPSRISSCKYFLPGYVHQGWLTEDRKYFLVDDEGDESGLFSRGTETFVCDVSNLDFPIKTSVKRAETSAIDHNLYVVGNYAYQSNYRAGFRILDLSCIEYGGPFLEEVGYFDIYPEDDDNFFNGSWSNYPFFQSGIVIVSGVEQGLYILRPDIPKSSSSFLKALQNVISGLL